jgi:Leucine-rich repeat (LRR) protein
MLGVFSRHLKDGDTDQAVRFLSEDLPEANEYLEVFERVRKKKVFKTGAPNRPNAPDNVTDINQYKDLAHLYSIVSPFIGADEEDEDDGVSPIWKKMKKYIDLGHARLAYRDNDVLVYIPDTIESSCDPLGNLASWCTRREGNSYFKSYREENKKPDGSNSDLYVVVPKEVFEGDDVGGRFPLQFHFETGQLHDKNNTSIENDFNNLMSNYSGAKEFFKRELGVLATGDIEQGSGLMDSRYLKYLNKFGGKAKDVMTDATYKKGVESIRKLASEQTGQLQNNKYLKWLMENTDGVQITDYLDPSIEVLDFSNMELTELPDISKFVKVTRLSANQCGLVKLPPVNYLPKSIEVLTMTGNQIKEVPLKDYGTLTNCFVMNFGDNPVTKINVEVLEKLVREALARFVLANVNLDNLSPENLAQYRRFEEDPDSIGYLVA